MFSQRKWFEKTLKSTQLPSESLLVEGGVVSRASLPVLCLHPGNFRLSAQSHGRFGSGDFPDFNLGWFWCSNRQFSGVYPPKKRKLHSHRQPTQNCFCWRNWSAGRFTNLVLRICFFLCTMLNHPLNHHLEEYFWSFFHPHRRAANPRLTRFTKPSRWFPATFPPTYPQRNKALSNLSRAYENPMGFPKKRPAIKPLSNWAGGWGRLGGGVGWFAHKIDPPEADDENISSFGKRMRERQDKTNGDVGEMKPGFW